MLCVVVLVAENGEFQRFQGFASDVFITTGSPDVLLRSYNNNYKDRQ